jgi:hypothetical protein
MAVEIDTGVALRGMNDLRRLVEAVVGADENDELDWLEWKSTLDLSTKHGCFQVAKAVLGMANRAIEQAKLACEGLGYVVVGAEPGRLHGLVSVDPAMLDQIIEPYIGGANGPRWTSTYVPVDDGKVVLVVTVEAPKAGDRIFSLRREFDKAKTGTIFVRKPGRTVPADPIDLEALQDRLVESSEAAMAAAQRSVEALERVAERADRDSRTQRIHSLLDVVLEMRRLFNEQHKAHQGEVGWCPGYNSPEALARLNLSRKLETHLVLFDRDRTKLTMTESLSHTYNWGSTHLEMAIEEGKALLRASE